MEYFVCRGVLQGSPLSAVLFDVYLDPIFEITKSRIIFYADDIKLLNSIHSELQIDLYRITDWLASNDLRINFSKNVCVFYSFRQSSPFDLFINNLKIKVTDEVSDLGILFDRKLTFFLQILNIIKKNENEKRYYLHK